MSDPLSLLADVEKAHARLVYIAEHLFAMVTQETWRATGGDDGQGHYEGDYHAEQVAREIEAWKQDASLARFRENAVVLSRELALEVVVRLRREAAYSLADEVAALLSAREAEPKCPRSQPS